MFLRLVKKKCAAFYYILPTVEVIFMYYIILDYLIFASWIGVSKLRVTNRCQTN